MFSAKYKPINIDNIIGNLKTITELQNWINNWSTKTSKQKKYALIYGTCGIGKTLTTELLCNKYDMNPFYLTTDEKRDKEYIETMIYSFIKTKNSVGTKKRNILIIDDIDSSTGDYKFIPTVVNILRMSSIPIILICNNKYAQQLKPVISYCVDFRFSKPSYDNIMKFLRQICKNEKIHINDTEMSKIIIEISNYDIRHCLNTLTIWNKSNIIVDKDNSQSYNIFDSTKHIISQCNDFNKKYDIYWSNTEIIPFMIHENYILNNIKMKKEYDTLNNIANASECLSNYDILDTRIGVTIWELLPYCACSVINATYYTSDMQINFSKYIGKLNTINKKQLKTFEYENDINKYIINDDKKITNNISIPSTLQEMKPEILLTSVKPKRKYTRKPK